MIQANEGKIDFFHVWSLGRKKADVKERKCPNLSVRFGLRQDFTIANSGGKELVNGRAVLCYALATISSRPSPAEVDFVDMTPSCVWFKGAVSRCFALKLKETSK